MFWANFLHLYQPPSQKKSWVERITREAYRPVLQGLIQNPQVRVTFNINGVLFDLWSEFGERDVIDAVRELLERGQIELTGSAKFHPLLPKLPEEEIRRQIELNNQTLSGYLGDAYQPKGFFPPEMAYDQKVAKVAREFGFSWVIADELSFPGRGDMHTGVGWVAHDRIYQDKEAGLTVFFRERELSFELLSGRLGTQKLFLDTLDGRVGKNDYLLTAMDGETFGHHRPGMDKALMELLRTPGVKVVSVSDLLELFPQVEMVETRPSTWALIDKDLEKKIPFARWDDPDNEIHKLQWELTDLAIKSVRQSANPGKSREMLDRALHSDQYWWASARPWWSLEMIERGAYELRETILATPDSTEEVRRQARELYFAIVTKGFAWQRTGKVDALAKAEDEEIRQHVDAKVKELPKAELEKMVARIKSEMEEVAKDQEYERAAALRDRIKELEGYEGGSS